MRSVAVANFEKWRQAARELLANEVPPDQVLFTSEQQNGLFESLPVNGGSQLTVPKAFLLLAQDVALFRDSRRWNLLYRTLYRIVCGGERYLLKVETDPDVRELTLMQKAVDRDIHKMHAYVRFRKIDGDPEQFVAWYRPDHLIMERVAPWFAKRFGAMHWAIMTPDQSATWDMQSLRYGPGVPRSAAPDDDAMEELWRSYYASIFNPARVNVAAMTRELPIRHWATLPEANLIPNLVMGASRREDRMRNEAPPSAASFLPAHPDLPTLAQAICSCQGCDLYRHATQAVFGEGPTGAHVMFVGEQPGDQEDLQGKPFRGPAGQLFNRALHDAGIERAGVYVTNAVKHFKFEERGKRRIHQKPRGVEVAACRPWLSAEIDQVNPRIIVALGATAALSVGGREFAIQKERGRLLPIGGERQMLVTVHPSYLLRIPEENQPEEYGRFVNDLRLVA